MDENKTLKAKTMVKRIETFAQLVPEKGLWFNYYDELFVSVVPISQRRPYVRRKASLTENKSDNKMCSWHFDWQYRKVESSYGLPVNGKKTFEQPINFEGEKHIIDSVVDNIALEFQHSLNVSVAEMDKRYIAHAGNNLVPYLLLDFTNQNFQSSFNNASNYNFDFYYACKMYPNKIASGFAPKSAAIYRKLRKWAECIYFDNNRLFIEFSDAIVRPLNMKIRCDKANNYDRFLIYTPEEFLKELFNLEFDITVKTKPYDHFSSLRTQWKNYHG